MVSVPRQNRAATAPFAGTLPYQPRIIVFAKAPCAGFAKTRLIPRLGAHRAALLARRLLHATIASALTADLGPVELCVTPQFESPAWRDVDLPHGITIHAQGEGDLGARLARAAARACKRGESPLLIGTDCPALDAAALRTASAALRGSDVVLQRALDGGYVLLGLRQFDPCLFENIPWSTASVASMTEERVRRLGWSIHLARELPDIDEPADLIHVPQQWLTENDA
jgi:uncharacterized protein